MKGRYDPTDFGMHRHFCARCGKEFYSVDEIGPDVVCPDCFWEYIQRLYERRGVRKEGRK